MAKSELIRILVKGGILSPGYFLKIIETARRSGNETLHFGSRQDILFEVTNKEKESTEQAMNEAGIAFEWKGSKEMKTQNIVSSFVTSGILESTSWVTESTYLKILENFDYSPQVKINLVDARQNLIPLFNGWLNFVSSESYDYWYLYINQSNELTKAPFLISSNEIHIVSRFCELLTTNNQHISPDEIIQQIASDLHIKKNNSADLLNLPGGFFPFYEGIEKMKNGKNYWVGFYWRNNSYDFSFIEKVCKLCLQTGVAKISITPWKTFLIKDIKPEDLILWEQLIGRMGINMRHSSIEMNWHLPVLDKSAFRLKKQIVKSFDKVDVRTFGLTFSIEEKDSPTIYTSIRIIKKPLFRFSGNLNIFVSYTILVAKNYDPNTLEYDTYASNLDRNEITTVLIDVCKNYYSGLSLSQLPSSDTNKKEKEVKKPDIYQCSNCFTIYDEQLVDQSIGIKAGTFFNELPDNYCCPLCESPKSAFVKKPMSEKYLISV